LENFANENHEMPDRRPDGTKFSNSWTFVITISGYKLIFLKPSLIRKGNNILWTKES